MPMVRAIAEYAYGGALRRIGDEFEASDRDAELLHRVKRAEIVEPGKSATTEYQTASVTQADAVIKPMTPAKARR